MKCRYSVYGFVCGLVTCLLVCLSVTTVWADTRSGEIHIPVSCIGENTSEEFEYVLKSKQTAYQTASSDTLKLSNGMRASFDITYTGEGMYEYEVVQAAGTDADTVYDSTVYKAVVYVSHESDGLVADVIAYQDGSDEKVSELTFKNVKTIRDNKPADIVNPTSPSNPVDSKELTNTAYHPSSPTETDKSTSDVQTGDMTDLKWYLCGTAVSLSAILLILRKKRGEHDEAKIS